MDNSKIRARFLNVIIIMNIVYWPHNSTPCIVYLFDTFGLSSSRRKELHSRIQNQLWITICHNEFANEQFNESAQIRDADIDIRHNRHGYVIRGRHCPIPGFQPDCRHFFSRTNSGYCGDVISFRDRPSTSRNPATIVGQVRLPDIGGFETTIG